MKLFIHDIPVVIKKLSKKTDLLEFDYIINGGNKNLYVSMLVGHLLVHNASLDQIDRLFKLMKGKSLKKLKSVTFTVDDRESVVHFVKEKFRIIKAAGGLVRKKGQVLLILRLKKWDLPKGKLEKNESPSQGAKREVEEECNVKVSLDSKICSTWHTYSLNGKNILKKTTWYSMTSLDDSKMKPQIQEDIEEVRWMGKEALTEALYSTYPSIRHVFEVFEATKLKKVKAS
ncbi:MAG: NUDIX hydrolase [Cyclobacteriaceae bacterium]